MNLLVVGDVHGCVHTLKAFVKNHWNDQDEFLILVGDVINKGRHSAKTLKYLRKLKKEFPYAVHILKGNHEQMALDAMAQNERPGYLERLKRDMLKRGLSYKRYMAWLQSWPLKWENPYILITHAGVALHARDPFNPHSSRGVLHNRSLLKDVGKLQIFENLQKNQYYAILNNSRVLFNCALQDWVSNTVSEADACGANVLYPAYR
ncbi:MAG: serine/threonine protein phosphatase, partial [Flavobacteriia bacterium]|nr:serine/threonine protein phosphatase [Flavobacteriia bacterium]